MRLLPDLAISWELKDVENFDDPNIRFVGCYLDSTSYESTFISNDEWFLGYQRWYEDKYDNEANKQKYIKYIHEIKVGDILIMSHKSGSSTHIKATAVGVVLFFRDLPVLNDKNEPTHRTYRVFKMAWTNKNLNLDVPLEGFWDKGGSASRGYNKSNILSDLIPKLESKPVVDGYKALMKEVDKARHRFLRLNLSSISPRNY
jgi:hypothetical protein